MGITLVEALKGGFSSLGHLEETEVLYAHTEVGRAQGGIRSQASRYTLADDGGLAHNSVDSLSGCAMSLEGYDTGSFCVCTELTL